MKQYHCLIKSHGDGNDYEGIITAYSKEAAIRYFIQEVSNLSNIIWTEKEIEKYVTEMPSKKKEEDESDYWREREAQEREENVKSYFEHELDKQADL